LLVARGRYEEAIALLDSTISSGVSAGMNYFLLGAVAGAPMIENAQGVVGIAKQYFGQSYENLGGPMTAWLLGSFHLMQGETDDVESIQAALSRLVSEGKPGAAAYAEAIGAQIALAEADTSAALSTFAALRSNARRDDLFWGLVDQFPVERLMLARLLVETGRYEEALRAASVFDQEPIVFVPFLPASLEVRIEAAEALGLTDRAEEYDRRLRRLRQ
jgi:hypothetical protein